MINKLYFNIDKESSEKKKSLIESIDKESKTIGYYKLPEQNQHHSQKPTQFPYESMKNWRFG